MHRHSVTFLPDDKTVVVEGRKTILEAAEIAGVYINSVCGGDGLCGRCKAIVRSGDVSTEPTAYLDRDEIQRGYVLACKCWVQGDIVVEVPEESRLEGAPRLADEDAVRFGAARVLVGEGVSYLRDPLSRKVPLSLPPPTVEDRLADLERLYRELRRDRELPILQTGLAQLRQLGHLLRENDWQVTATLGQRGGTVEVIQIEGGDTSHPNYGVAVDVGTTTVVAHLVDLNTSETVARNASYNSQIQYGDDVISRIMAASTPDGLNAVASCIVRDLNNLIAGLVVAAGVSMHDVTYILCAGNTTMTHFAMGMDPASIRLEPYIPTVVFPPVVRAAEVGVKINPRGLLGCLPSVSGYVGGDVVAGVLVSGMTRFEASMLIDVGTNGEIVVGNKDWLMCCSASPGPAFEGGGISSGMRASRGAIERLTMTKGCQISSYSVIGGGKPAGLCGSGLIDTISEMLRCGGLERSGVISRDSLTDGRVRDGEDGVEFVIVDSSQTSTGKDIVITQADITNFIRSKGAIFHACHCLLEHVGLAFSDLQSVYISGGFGNYLDARKAVTIGLVPDIPLERFQFIGNGSVQGAKTILLSRSALADAEEIAAKMTYIELSTDPRFMNEYTAALFLPHTNIELFPSVLAEMMAGRFAADEAPAVVAVGGKRL